MLTRKPTSLAQRLIGGILVAQALALIGWVLVLMTASPYLSYEELAAHGAGRRVAEATVVDGTAAIVPAGGLADYAARRAGFRYAAIVDAEVVPGSDPQLGAYLSALGGAAPLAGRYRLADGLIVYAQTLPADAGEVTVVTAGNRFGAEDLPVFFEVYLPQLVLMFAPAFLAGAIAMRFAVQRALRPLRRASVEASTIGVASLKRRIALDPDLPEELAPLISAINDLLARLEAGVAARRIFAASAAHELRTPLAVLDARIESTPDGPLRTALRRDARRLLVLVEQLLAAARLENEAGETRRPLDAVALARQVVSDLVPLAVRGGHSIAFASDARRATIMGDGDAIASMLRNLVDNAVRVEPAGGTVTVGIHEEDEAVVFAVRDHGPGIAPEDQARMFDPFWRKRADGAGLGLPIARQIALAHGGDIACHSAPGRGAEFRVRLPNRCGGDAAVVPNAQAPLR